MTSKLGPESKSSSTWTILVAQSAYEELAAMADQQGVPLDRYVADLIAIRSAVELIAPSPTWLAIPTQVFAVHLTPSPDLVERIAAVCELTGQHQDVVISNLASGGPPMSPPRLQLGYLRTDPGRGRIFGMYFEIAGFQYSLMRHLAGDAFRNSQALDAAFVALASQAATTGKFMNEPITDVARQFAAKVVMIANRRRPAPGEVAMKARSETTLGEKESIASKSRRRPTDILDSAATGAVPKSVKQPREGDPFATFNEWDEDIDTKAYGKL